MSNLETLKKEYADLLRTFELRWKADMRAVRRWQASGTGRELTFPDRADMVVWLLEKLEQAEAKVKELSELTERISVTTEIVAVDPGGHHPGCPGPHGCAPGGCDGCSNYGREDHG